MFIHVCVLIVLVHYILLTCYCTIGAFGKVSEGTWRDPTNNKETRVAIKTLRSEFVCQIIAAWTERVIVYTQDFLASLSPSLPLMFSQVSHQSNS